MCRHSVHSGSNRTRTVDTSSASSHRQLYMCMRGGIEQTATPRGDSRKQNCRSSRSCSSSGSRMVLCGKLDGGHKGWIERVVCFFKKRIQNANNKDVLVVVDANHYFERKWAFTQQPARCNSESNLANIGRAMAAGGGGGGGSGGPGAGHAESGMGGRIQHSQDDLQLTVTLCDEYQDPVDLIAELKNSRALAGSDGCLEDMYSTPYASMNLASSAKLAAAAAASAVARNGCSGAGGGPGARIPPRPQHVVRRANSTSASHGGGGRGGSGGGGGGSGAGNAAARSRSDLPAVPQPQRKGVPHHHHPAPPPSRVSEVSPVQQLAAKPHQQPAIISSVSSASSTSSSAAGSASGQSSSSRQQQQQQQQQRQQQESQASSQQFQGPSSPAGPPVPAPRHPRQGTTYQNLPQVDAASNSSPNNASSNSNGQYKTPPRTSSRQPFPLPGSLSESKDNNLQQNPSCDNRPEEDYDSPWDLPKGGQPAVPAASQRPAKACTSSVSSIASSSQSSVVSSSGLGGVGGGGAGGSSLALGQASGPASGDSSPHLAPRIPAHRSTSSASSASSSDHYRPGSKQSAERPQELLPSNNNSESSSPASRPSLPLNLNGSPKRSRGNMAFNFGCSVPLPQAEPVDPALGLARQGWYHGAISRVDAETLLRAQKEGSYLVRISESSKQDYSLSIKSARGFMHMKIVHKPDGRFVLGQFSKPFESIPEMIHHYSLNKLPIKGAEHMSLLHPVIAQLL